VRALPDPASQRRRLVMRCTAWTRSAAVRRSLLYAYGRDTMANEHQEQPGEERQLDASIRKLQVEFHQFIHECQACQREIAPHWQVCAHCGVRLATHCPGCGNPLPPAGAQACPRCGVAVPQD
jgi:hypothetical protein